MHYTSAPTMIIYGRGLFRIRNCRGRPQFWHTTACEGRTSHVCPPQVQTLSISRSEPVEPLSALAGDGDGSGFWIVIVRPRNRLFTPLAVDVDLMVVRELMQPGQHPHLLRAEGDDILLVEAMPGAIRQDQRIPHLCQVISHAFSFQVVPVDACRQRQPQWHPAR